MKHPVAKSVGWALVHAARLHRTRVGEHLTALGLFPGQEQVLQALATADSMTMGELSYMLRVKPPTASKTIARLTAQGLVERVAGPGDARIVAVRLTEEGAGRVAAIDKLWGEVEEELLEGFDSKERKRMRKLLRKAARNLAGTHAIDEGDEEGDAEDTDDIAE
ncbi:MarR family winged helix-turn-helix transcriptional regulator [Pseudochelatococcus sp. G4_1912]|uniref:MarR family winged helix-turn-helix transcriptional regulator n=1 Tax=Pseudochelatococcus sp. G4_1912 TaxID=3114288 RepID=UPI0039C62B78